MGSIPIPKLDDYVLPTEGLGLGTAYIYKGKYNKGLEKKASFFIQRRCSHSTSSPYVYIAPSHHRPRPDIGRKISKNIRISYTKTKKFLPSFNFLNGMQKRSQRREVGLLVLEALFQFTDYLSLEVGKFLNLNQVEPMPLTTDIKNRRMGNDDSFSLLREINRGREPHEIIGVKRMQRALQDLKKAKLIEVVERKTINKWGQSRSLVAIKRITMKTLSELGIHPEELKRERDRKKKNLIKDEIRAKQTKHVKEVFDFLNQKNNKIQQTPINVLTTQALEELKQENNDNNLLVEIKKQNPDVDPRLAMLDWLKHKLRKKPPS